MNRVTVGFFVLCVSLATSVQGMAQTRLHARRSSICGEQLYRGATRLRIAAVGAFSQIH